MEHIQKDGLHVKVAGKEGIIPYGEEPLTRQEAIGIVKEWKRTLEEESTDQNDSKEWKEAYDNESTAYFLITRFKIKKGEL